MRHLTAGLLLALGCANAANRYVIHYDDAAWQSLHVNSLPDNTVDVLHNLQMTVADLSAEEVAMYESIPGVQVFEDVPVEPFGKVQENPASWGIDRIDQRDLPLDKKFAYGTEGEGVDVYVIDSGIRASHVEFGGRVKFEKNFANDKVDTDCMGHGTHVASTIGGNTVGIAKKATIHDVKVFPCRGGTTSAVIISAINHVVGIKTSNPEKKMVINMSLGGSRMEAENFAVKSAHKAGVVVVVAAGNSNRDACLFSPASAPEAISVAASDVQDKHAPFTNHGKCVHLYAPGVAVNGAFLKGETNDTYAPKSGTSMASPHVAGVAALVLSSGIATTPDEVKAKILEAATKDHIKSGREDTVNKLLYADPTWGDKTNTKASGFSSFRSLNNL